MNNHDLYQAVFSQVHTDVRIKMEDVQTMKPIHRIKKRVVGLAVAVCLIFTCSVTAFATNLWGLRDLLLDQDPPEVSEEAQSMEMISLQGFSDSNEYKALAEWMAFTDSYDQDGTILNQIGNGPTGLDEKYSLYLVYSQEMADKLDEITAKYHLSLHRGITDVATREDLFAYLGTSDFLGETNTPYSTYMYEDGTFHFDGSASLEGGLNIDYQFMRCVKGSFTDVPLNIGTADAYNTWDYTTTSGVTVLLSLGPDKALVIADLERSFVSINVLEGTESESGAITAENLEAFADSFDFSALN